MKTIADIDPNVLAAFRKGTVIPAQPLALDENRCFMPRNQRALCRYYIDAGVGGIAVGVHSTQFEIRKKEIGLFEPVLQQTSRFIDEWCERRGRKILKVGGICGKTEQALYEAEFEAANGYDAGLLSLSAFAGSGVDEMLEHCKAVAKIMPVIGFYLQPSVGGRILPFDFWKQFTEIENVIGIKMAPFNRYCTIDVIRAVAESGKNITLYTGNDDNIVVDLLTDYDFNGVKQQVKGGLLGHWCCWSMVILAMCRPATAIWATLMPEPNLLSNARPCRGQVATKVGMELFTGRRNIRITAITICTSAAVCMIPALCQLR